VAEAGQCRQPRSGRSGIGEGPKRRLDDVFQVPEIGAGNDRRLVVEYGDGGTDVRHQSVGRPLLEPCGNARQCASASHGACSPLHAVTTGTVACAVKVLDVAMARAGGG